ncbi:protein containing Regulator of K+ conductance, partial [human gut metagenome]
MGEDNRVVNINRSDVANVAYGLGNLTLDDRTKYGQCVEYANSLISQGAPVRFMRVTPEDATYGLSCILVQWRIDETDNNMHVRFKEAEIPSDMILNRFKNKADRRADFVDVLPEMWYNLLNSAQTAQEKRKGYSMKIVLVGGGKVGTALARQLSEEGHNVTVIDTNKARVEHIGESYDVMSILGNGSSIITLSEAGVEEADVFIAVTGSDELNLLCCMFAKKAGHCHAI